MLPTHSTRKQRTTPATVVVFIVVLLGLLGFCGYSLKQSQSSGVLLSQQLASLQQAHEALGKEKKEADERLEQSITEVEVARKERSALEKVSGEATAKLKDLDAQRATLIKTHAKDRQTWETQLRAAQAAEKDARTVAAKAAARAEELQSKSKTAAVTDATEDATGSRASSKARQHSSAKADAVVVDSSGTAGKAQTGSTKAAATDGDGSTAGGSGSAKKVSDAVSAESALERDPASPSMKKQAAQEGNAQKVKTRADGQLTQGLAAADDVVSDGKALSAGSSITKEQPLDRAAAAKETDRLAAATGSQRTAGDEEAESESVEDSSEREESGEAAVEGVGAARLQAARG